MIRTEKEIMDKIENSMEALRDFANKEHVEPEEFFVVARQATFLTALYWVLGENVPKEVTALAVPIAQKMSEAQAADAKAKAAEAAPKKEFGAK